MRIYVARNVLPVSSAPIADGAVAVDEGRIVAVGPRDRIVDDHAGAEIDDLGDDILMPGLVNAHTHLELSWVRDGVDAGGDYETWLRGLLRLRAEEDEERARQAATEELKTIAARGTVAIGDVSNSLWIVPLLAASPLHAVLFHEIYGFRAADAESLLEQAALELDRAEAAVNDVGLRVVATPHGPHTTSAPLLRALAGRAEAAGEPLSIHVAESREECRLLADGDGPIRELHEERGGWETGWEAPGLTPVAYLHRLGLLSSRTLAVHCVHLTHEDHSLLQSTGATVISCPRSNRHLGVGAAPVPELLREGIPVALGTDSLSSSPDLDLFGEMTALREVHPRLAPAAVLRMATLNGARALGLDDRLGSLEPGKLAEIVAVSPEAGAENPLEYVCSNPATVRLLRDGGETEATGQ